MSRRQPFVRCAIRRASKHEEPTDAGPSPRNPSREGILQPDRDHGACLWLSIVVHHPQEVLHGRVAEAVGLWLRFLPHHAVGRVATFSWPQEQVTAKLQPSRERTNDSKARPAPHTGGIGRPAMCLVGVPGTLSLSRARALTDTASSGRLGTGWAANKQENDPGFWRAWPEAAGYSISSLFQDGR